MARLKLVNYGDRLPEIPEKVLAAPRVGMGRTDSDLSRLFGNSGMRCSRERAPDALPAGMCLTDPAANGGTLGE